MKNSKQQARRGSRLNKAVQVDAWLLVPVLLLLAANRAGVTTQMGRSAILGLVGTNALFDAAPDAWIIADGAGRIVAANALAPRIFGIAAHVGDEIERITQMAMMG